MLDAGWQVHTHPQILPGGKAMLLQVVVGAGQFTVDVVSIADRAHKTLARGFGSPRYLPSGPSRVHERTRRCALCHSTSSGGESRDGTTHELLFANYLDPTPSKIMAARYTMVRGFLPCRDAEGLVADQRAEGVDHDQRRSQISHPDGKRIAAAAVGAGPGQYRAGQGRVLLQLRGVSGEGCAGKAVSLVPGTRLGPYEVVSALGAGGMGEVYRATDTKLKPSVAIKIPAAVGRGRPHGGDQLAGGAERSNLTGGIVPCGVNRG